MAHQIITNQVNVMDLSRIIDKEEYIVDLIAEVGLPPIVVTNKKMYKMLLGQGIVVETGEPYNAHNQLVEAFDFSVDCGYKVDRDINTAHCFHFVLDDGKWQFIEEFEPEIMQKY